MTRVNCILHYSLCINFVADTLGRTASEEYNLAVSALGAVTW